MPKKVKKNLKKTSKKSPPKKKITPKKTMPKKVSKAKVLKKIIPVEKIEEADVLKKQKIERQTEIEEDQSVETEAETISGEDDEKGGGEVPPPPRPPQPYGQPPYGNPPSGNDCPTTCVLEGKQGGRCSATQPTEDAVCRNNLFDCPATGSTGAGYKTWTPATVNTCTTGESCFCYRQTCCGTYGCDATTGLCAGPAAIPPGSETLTVQICPEKPQELNCGPSDGLCPLRFGIGWGSNHIQNCCALDSDCRADPNLCS